MKKVTGDEIRELFLRFFEEKGHQVIPSSSLVPLGDPTLLLTTAGMVQFKRYFTGEATPPHPRLASCQKCFRTTDIESVGDSKHLTFFEMLGNFSVGDYFKREAIEWAWEFVTQSLGLPPERLWATIFLDDDEAFRYWQGVGVPRERILRFGEEDNFWGPAGESGPCGPCSEIHYDLGEGIGCGRAECGPGCECGRFVEIWNLVFTQYDQQRDGRRVPLPKPNIDTGMGLERTAAAVQGKASVYETDLFAPLIELVSRLAGKGYGKDEASDRALRIVAEHGRAITFLIADGVVPSNEGRGYVLRRVLRRAALFGRKLGLEGPFLGSLARAVMSQMGQQYLELMTNRDFILSTIEAEEARFSQTLVTGLNLLDRIMEEAKQKGKSSISGEDIFKLYDTYGFPKELTAEIAAENGLTVDFEAFEEEMERQRERARAAQRVASAEEKAEAYAALSAPPTVFVGDEALKKGSTIVALLLDGQPAETASEGDEVEVVLRETPFYGEMGGQVGDSGEIRGEKGRMTVTNTIRHTEKLEGAYKDLFIHQGKVVEGQISVNDEVEAIVDEKRRLDIARNHTATHLLQAALRQMLGSQVQQAGSLVAPDRFRFDFTYSSTPTREQLMEVQHMVNEWVRQNLPVRDRRTSYREAIARGALAFFGEKYGEEVRVLEIGKPPFSRELCGGTHVRLTGEIGLLLILGESSIGAGMRRIEAVTGRGAEEFVEKQVSIVEETAQELGAKALDIKGRISDLRAELEAERKRALTLERELLRRKAKELAEKAEPVGEFKILAEPVEEASSIEALRQMGDFLKGELGKSAIVLGTILHDRPNFVVMGTADAVKRGFHAGRLVKEVAAVTGGGGGGTAKLGQGGGRDKNKLGEALKLARKLLKESIQKS